MCCSRSGRGLWMVMDGYDGYGGGGGDVQRTEGEPDYDVWGRSMVRCWRGGVVGVNDAIGLRASIKLSILRN